MTNYSDLVDRHSAIFPDFVRPLYSEPLVIDRGYGSYVWDGLDRRYLDWFGGVLTTMVGHAHPQVVAAVEQQVQRIAHTSTLYISEPVVALAEDIARLSGIPNARVFFTASGSEANDTAVMAACSFRGSGEMLALRNGYHGRSYTSQALTGNRFWSLPPLSSLKVGFVEGSYRLRSPMSSLDDEAYVRACVEDLVQTIDMASSGNVAAMIAEPIQGVGGFSAPPDGLLGSMQKELENREILYISDEVQTGWGRTGDNFWGYQAHGVQPDMLTFAKGLGNGLGIAGVVGRADVLNSIDRVSFSTFGGTPLAAAAARATLRVVIDEDLQGNARRMGALLASRVRQTVETSSALVELRGRGLMQAIEVVHPGGIQPDPMATDGLLEAARSRGLLVGRGGLYNNVVRIAPMLNSTEDEIEEGAELLVEAIGEAC